jgi:hypothetical protein
MPTGYVEGRVHRSGVPLNEGWLELMPVDGTIGRLRSIRIGPDGRFQAHGVPIGEVAIRISGGAISRTSDAMFSRIYAIRRAIAADGPTRLDLDLDRERRSILTARAG